MPRDIHSLFPAFTLRTYFLLLHARTLCLQLNKNKHGKEQYETNNHVLFTDVLGHDIYKVAREYASCVSPAEWTYYVYIPIWVWQLVWIAFGIFNDCRKATDGKYVSEYDLIASDVFIAYSLASVLLTIWLQLLTHQRVIFSSVAATFVFVLLIVACVRSCRSLYVHLDDLMRAGLVREVWFVRVFIHNGLACYALLMCEVMLENIVASLFFTYDARESQVSYAATTTLALTVLLTFWIDVTVFDNYMRYIIAPYAFYLYIIAGLFSKNYNIGTNTGTSMFLACLASCTVLVLVTKIMLTLQRHRNCPLENRYSYDVTRHTEPD